MVGNISQVGYAAVLWNNNKTWGNATRVGLQVGIIIAEGFLNGLCPGLGVLVGIGLNIVEAEYGQYLYNYVDGK